LINIYFLIFINKFVRYKRTNILFILILVNIYFLSFFYLFIVNNFSKASGGSLGSLVVTTFHEGVGNLVELGNVWLDLAVVQKWLRCLDMALAGVS
jgi:Ca2+/H+ antiporter